jgi:hypothetical protein
MLNDCTTFQRTKLFIYREFYSCILSSQIWLVVVKCRYVVICVAGYLQNVDLLRYVKMC